MSTRTVEHIERILLYLVKFYNWDDNQWSREYIEEYYNPYSDEVFEEEVGKQIERADKAV